MFYYLFFLRTKLKRTFMQNDKTGKGSVDYKNEVHMKTDNIRTTSLERSAVWHLQSVLIHFIGLMTYFNRRHQYTYIYDHNNAQG